MKKNKEFLVGIFSVLALIITIHVALFSKYENDKQITCNAEMIKTNHSLQFFELILFIPVRGLPGAT